MHNLQKINLFVIFLISFHGISIASEEIDFHLKKKDAFVISEHNEKATMAGVLDAGTYGPKMTAKTVLEALSKEPENIRWSYPEYIAAMEFKAMKDGDFKTIYSLYKAGTNIDEVKKLYSDMPDVAKTFEKWPDMRFLSKSFWGPYVRIRCEYMNDKEKPFPTVFYAKKLGERYYATTEITNEHLFSRIASSHPLNLKKSDYKQPSLKDFNYAIHFGSDSDGKLILLEDQTSPPEDHGFSFYFNLDLYEKGASLVSTEKGNSKLKLDRKVQFLSKVVQIFKEGNEDNILKLWHSKSNNEIKDDLSMGGTLVKRFQRFYKSLDDIKLIASIDGPDGAIILYRPIKGKEQLSIQPIVFKREGDEYRLADKLGGSYIRNISKIVTDKIVLEALDKQLKKDGY